MYVRGNEYAGPRSLPGVLILYNIPAERIATHGGEAESGVMKEVEAVSIALEKLCIPFRSIGIHRLEELPDVLAMSCEPVVFNLVESLDRHPEYAGHIPAICLGFGKVATGCYTDCLSLTLHKWRTKAVLQAAGLLVPAGVVVPVGELFRPDGTMHGPYIVKPCALDASEGIGSDSVFDNFGPDLQEAVRKIHEQLNQPVLVEQYVGAREFNISMLQRGGKVEILPIAEIDFSGFEPGRAKIVDYAAKWLSDTFQYRHTRRIIPAQVTENAAARIRNAVRQAWRTLDCIDYVRIDLRMDENGRIFVLEVNPNPDISPDAGFAAALAAAGISYEAFVETIIRNSVERGRFGTFRSRPEVATPSGDGQFVIRRTLKTDREDILDFVRASSFFRPFEIEVAREVLDEALAEDTESQYQSFTAEANGRAVGWICFGHSPGTVGTYDIYWIVVSSDYQRKGIGTALMQYVEKLIAGRGGRLCVIETSGLSMYRSTRGFYLKLGYVEQACVAEFYAHRDDKIICVKHLKSKKAFSRC